MNWVTTFFPHCITCSLARTLRRLKFCYYWKLHYRPYWGTGWGRRELLEETISLLEWWPKDLIWKHQLEEGLSLPLSLALLVISVKNLRAPNAEEERKAVSKYLWKHQPHSESYFLSAWCAVRKECMSSHFWTQRLSALLAPENCLNAQRELLIKIIVL